MVTVCVVLMSISVTCFVWAFVNAQSALNEATMAMALAKSALDQSERLKVEVSDLRAELDLIQKDGCHY